ncbi:uncharacterized protein LOC143560885 [Bidens hawaiensis]|uniref:uncharacterized protein LOC143560885 n=1 Tax=Bidens hawaiensis TaxID=980011 RepID=UPI004049A0E8
MTWVPRRIAEHGLRVNPTFTPIMQKKHKMGPEQTKAMNEQTWVANPVIVLKSNGTWRMCIDFNDLNKACPKDCYPLPEIDLKVDAEALSSLSDSLILTKGITKFGETYQCLMDEAFKEHIGHNLEVYIDDLANPENVQAVARMPSPSSLKEVQTLNGRLVDLNRFLANHTAKSFQFVSTLINCLKKAHFKCTAEAEQAFLEFKKCLIDLPTLTAPQA